MPQLLVYLFAGVLVYSFIGGVTAARTYHFVLRRCQTCEGTPTHVPNAALVYPAVAGHDPDTHLVTSWVAGLLWPLALPAVLGVLTLGQDAAQRLQNARAAELARARHDAQVASQRRAEAEHLTSQLRALTQEEKN